MSTPKAKPARRRKASKRKGWMMRYQPALDTRGCQQGRAPWLWPNLFKGSKREALECFTRDTGESAERWASWGWSPVRVLATEILPRRAGRKP